MLFGAVLTAEDGRVEVGARSVIMENALLRACAFPSRSATTCSSARTRT